MSVTILTLNELYKQRKTTTQRSIFRCCFFRPPVYDFSTRNLVRISKGSSSSESVLDLFEGYHFSIFFVVFLIIGEQKKNKNPPGIKMHVKPYGIPHRVKIERRSCLLCLLRHKIYDITRSFLDFRQITIKVSPISFWLTAARICFDILTRLLCDCVIVPL